MQHNIDVPKVAEECLEELHQLHMLLHQFLREPPNFENFTSTPQALSVLILKDSIQMTSRKLQEMLESADLKVEDGEGKQLTEKREEEAQQEAKG